MSDGGGTSRELKCSRPVNALDAVNGAQLSQMVSGLQGKQNLAKHILRAGCCVLGADTGNLKGSGACDLMYYTVGSIVHKKFGEDAFGEIMEIIHNYIVSVLGKGECKQLPRNSAKELFKLMERKVDYSLTLDGVLGEEVNPKTVNCEKYTKYLEQVAEACLKVKEQCRSSDASSECTGIAEKDSQHSPEYVAQLIGSLNLKSQASTAVTKGQGRCLDSLPSQKLFKEFQRSIGTHSSCTSDGSVDRERGKLKECSDLEHLVDNIVQVWCAVSKMGEEGELSVERCNLLYYWTADILPNTSVCKPFSSLMSDIYSKLESSPVKSSCSMICTGDVKRDLVRKIWRVQRYCEDYATIRGKLDTGDTSCNGEYYSHLQDVSAAYGAVRTYCAGEKPKGQYCQKFETEYEKYSGSVLSELMCKLGHESDCPTSIAPAAISGTLITVGLPALGYFLYKYDLLPSWISNRLKNIVGGGSGRSRRVRSVRRNFDGSTADDASTVGSTLGDDSTVDYSTAEDVSTIYNAPPRRPTGRTRTGINNGRPGNIRYYAT